ncbi:YagK/YfjJ domain-containing protein [Providencia rettgeri]|nr:hypothetical protein N4838_016880 [Providencia rettgeri]
MVHYPENCRYCLNREALSFSDDYNTVIERLRTYPKRNCQIIHNDNL